MKQDQLINAGNHSAQQIALKEAIAQLKHELEDVRHQVESYEAKLRAHLTPEIIEMQELSVLYKEQKQAKKVRRLAQKRKGKTYVEPVGLKVQKQQATTAGHHEADSKEKKRLYREAMLLVHPDKFSMNDDKIDLATELTTRLVAIYKHDDLDTLKAFHAHIFSNVDFMSSPNKIELQASPNAYLIQEKEELENALSTFKSKHLYHVLTTYQDPSTFIDELKAYYQDRINKLRRRTRTKDRR